MDFHILRQNAGVELLRHCLDAFQDRLRLLASAHEDHTLDGVVLVVVAKLSKPGRVSDDDVADVAHENRCAILDREDDVSDVVQGHDAAEPTHIKELPAFGVKAAAGVAIVRA